MPLSHHERWDGGGYPQGLKEDAIPVPGRIMALADVFEAMTMTQYYREPMDVLRAAKAIAAPSGKQFDPRLVVAFQKALPKLIEVKNAQPDERAGMHDLNFMAPASKPAGARAGSAGGG